MRLHELDYRFLIVDHRDEGPLLNSGFLTQTFGQYANNLEGFIHHSAQLDALAASFDYGEDISKIELQTPRHFSEYTGNNFADQLARAFGNYIEPMLGSNLKIMFKQGKDEEEKFHQDVYGLTATFPLGVGQPSTIWKNQRGQIITPRINSLVVFEGAVFHAKPPKTKDRVIMVATPY